MANRDTQQAPSVGGVLADFYDIGLGKFKELVDFEDAEGEAALARSNLIEADRIDDARAPAAGLFAGIDQQTLIIGALGLAAVLLLLR